MAKYKKIVNLIINADDFGYSENVNKAVRQAFRDKLVSSTTIIPNMAGFDQAISWSKSELFFNRVGIHLNLFEGTPLTDGIKKANIFCDEEGNFHGKPIKMYDPLRVNKKILWDELSEQVARVLKAGVKPTHLDSHGHIHTNFFIGSVVIQLSKMFNIPAIRISKNNIYSKTYKKIYAFTYNKRLALYGIKKVDCLGSISDVTIGHQKHHGIVEIITHPIFNSKNELCDAEYNTPLNTLLSPLSAMRKTSYACFANITNL